MDFQNTLAQLLINPLLTYELTQRPLPSRITSQKS